MIHLTIDGQALELAEPGTILKAARTLGIAIPTLCHHDLLSPSAACRLCLVEVTTAGATGRARLLPSCASPAEDGMVVSTDTPRVKESRAFVLELMLARCPDSAEMRRIAASFGAPVDTPTERDVVGDYLLTLPKGEEDTNCIRCGLCVRACAEIPQRHAISFSRRGRKRRVISPFEKIAESCIGCGSCAHVCPTKTITIEPAP
jgi:NADH dehydrogenase/NADH:ubiquinone oxidoreductase subunit G